MGLVMLACCLKGRTAVIEIPNFPKSTQALMEAFIANDYETLKQKPKYEVYGALVRACQEQEVTAPSYKTFALAVKKRPKQEQVQKRQGKRAAYQVSAFYLELTLTTPRHGDRPFEIAHIDHTQLDIELVCSHTGRNLGRPWATFLSDAFSRRLLAVYLTFDPPSYRSCMMVLRECVRRHTRLPQTMVVDGGKEFESIYFETLLARYECTKKSRPGASPRFGSVCERLFGTTNSRFIHNLMGNTQITRNVRQVTQAVTPQNQACWTLSALYTRLCEWAYEVYDQIEHAALGQTPREVFETGMQLGGQRPQRLIPYDESLHMLTLPTTRKGTARVVACLGVKIHYIHYWAEAFLDPEVEGTQVPVRFDPFDAGTAYAFVKGRWVRCFSEHYARFAGRSEREMMLATAELRKRRQRHNQQSTLTARQLADFLASLEAEELLLEQRFAMHKPEKFWHQSPKPGLYLEVPKSPKLNCLRKANLLHRTTRSRFTRIIDHDQPFIEFFRLSTGAAGAVRCGAVGLFPRKDCGASPSQAGSSGFAQCHPAAWLMLHWCWSLAPPGSEKPRCVCVSNNNCAKTSATQLSSTLGGLAWPVWKSFRPIAATFVGKIIICVPSKPWMILFWNNALITGCAISGAVGMENWSLGLTYRLVICAGHWSRRCITGVR